MKIIINYINNLYKIRIKFMDDYINNLIDNYYKDANLIGTLPNEFDYLKDKDVVKAEEEND
jgi:hypothetical protein